MQLGKKLKKIFNPKPIEGYVSDIDNFLKEFNQTHPESKSQRFEREKHARIAYRRDNPVHEDLMDEF